MGNGEIKRIEFGRNSPAFRVFLPVMRRSFSGQATIERDTDYVMRDKEKQPKEVKNGMTKEERGRHEYGQP
jgi:hypothetical protein